MTDRIELGLIDATAACACCTTPNSAATEIPSTAPAATEEILVSGMTCAHCASLVTEALTRVDGVQNVSVCLHAGGASRVTIQSATPISTSAVQAAVNEAGYTLDDSRI